MRPQRGVRRVLLLSGALTAAAAGFAVSSQAEEGVRIGLTRQALEMKWRDRVQGMLRKGQIPLIDLESSLKRRQAEEEVAAALPVMDELGVALIALDGYQAPRKSRKQRGYRWSYYLHRLVRAHPDRFILATNGGTNRNWLRGKSSFIGQLEEQVRSGTYPLIGELDFRHYMSSQQCKEGRTDRDSDIPLNGDNGRRLFALSAETGVPFVIHLEPEDHALNALEEMLAAFPGAKVIVAHFGQIRHPDREGRFTPDFVQRLLSRYPNLHYDLSVGAPGRQYRCDNDILDTVLWADAFFGQSDKLKPAYKSILTDFSTRFVAGMDYGGGRGPWSDFLRKRVRNLRLILADLPTGAKHDIAYRNAWRLLTGRDWKTAPVPRKP